MVINTSQFGHVTKLAIGLTEFEAKCLAKRKRNNTARRERDAAYRDMGLIKVRGALGGTYYE